jgi:predicted metal-dependent RNase
MKLTILGSGTSFMNKNATASAFLLDTGEKRILIDCGPGTLVKLAKADIKLEDIDYVFITLFQAIQQNAKELKMLAKMQIYLYVILPFQKTWLLQHI